MRNLVIIAILPLLFSSYFLFLKDPPVWPDEATSFYQAKTLLQTGMMNADIYGGIPNQAIQSGLSFPPIYFATLGVWTGVFGNSIEGIRSMSLVLGIACVVTFFFIIKSTPGVSGNLAFLGSLLLSTNVVFSRASRWGRPEILTLLLVLLSLLFLIKLLKGLKKPKLLFLSSLFASLATATHPIGIFAALILGLGILFLKTSLKQKFIYLLSLVVFFVIITASWILLTQESLPAFWQTLYYGSLDKIGKPTNFWILLTGSWSWGLLFGGHSITVITFIILILVKKRFTRENLFLIISTLITFLWVLWQKEGYYLLYLQPFFILIIISLMRFFPTFKWVILIFFLTINITIQYFDNEMYTPHKNLFQLQSYDYHQFADLVKSNLPDQPTTIFLSTVPDLYLTLKDNPHYTLKHAIDPNYPLDTENYKQVLDESDFVIYTWFPHEFLANYVAVNSLSVTPVEQLGGYGATIVKLKPKDQRKQ